MCKIAIFTNSSKLDVKKTTNSVGNILLSTERDGIGYAIQGVNGVYGEKCIDTSFKSRIDSKGNVPTGIIVPKYERFGVKSKPVGPLLLHGRISTNDKGLLNCHPMIRDNHYLIHNGVVSDDTGTAVKLTTNDSEDLLIRFIEGIKSVEENLTGYYAFGCIDPNGALHVVRDDQATLFITWLDKFDTYLIATTKVLIESIVKSMNIEVDAIDEVKPNVYMVYKGNELTYVQSIQPQGWNYNQSKHASASLGKIIDSHSNWRSDSFWDEHHRGYKTDEIQAYAEERFLDAVDAIDDTCTIWDKHGNEIDLHTFDNLTFTEQKMCIIETPSGEIIEYIEKAS